MSDLKAGEKVTIYTTGPGGYGWTKLEGKWVGVDTKSDGTICCVNYIRTRCRKPTSFMTYYNPTILVAKGHGLPDLRSNFTAPKSSQGGKVTTSKGLFNSCSPEWDNVLAEDTKDVEFALSVTPSWK